MNKLEQGFVRGASDNLPKVDFEMVNDFFVTNSNFFTAEMRNVKTDRATKQSYGDSAVQYVQLKRDGPVCTVKAKITPEHKIRKNAYTVCATIHEENDVVESCNCLDCPASTGGCKHGVAFLLWLHRRSEEPPVTSIQCYWKKSTLAKVLSSGKDIKSIYGKALPELDKRDPNVVNDIISICPGASGGIFDLYKTSKYKNISIHQIALAFTASNSDQYAENFLRFASTCMSGDLCQQAEILTRKQAKSLEWYELKYGRITASVIYDVSRCKTSGGALCEKILGGAQVLQTEAIKRGIVLEKEC